jgi:FkbM family methyltransferase
MGVVASLAETFPVVIGRKACRYGEMVYPLYDAFVGKAFHEYGEYSEKEVEFFCQVIRPGDVVLDIGANIGAFTVPFAQLVGDRGGVFAFEPQPFIFNCLCANVALNSLPNVIVNRSIVSSKPGTQPIPSLDYSQPGNFGGFTCDEPRGQIPTNVTTVDAFELLKCDFLKIDVEGMEREVLLGAVRTIAKFQPLLYVECDREGKTFALLETLKKLGYEWRMHEPPLFNPDNFAGNPVNHFPNTVSRNLMCAPQRPKDLR